MTYVSSAVRLFDRDELAGLLEHGASNNARIGITGLLLYIDGNFMQVLEGEEAAVRGLFGEIRRDPRHRSVIPLVREPIQRRHFANVSMGFVDGNRLPPQDRQAMLSLVDRTNLQPDLGTVLLQSFANTMAL